MKTRLVLWFSTAALLACTMLHAQEPVTAASDPAAMFLDKDPQLQANKQLVYHFYKDLLEDGRWDLADKYLSERYIQHNPNFPSTRAKFVEDGKSKALRLRIIERVVNVIAQKDTVVMALVTNVPEPGHPGQTYTTTWFNMFRVKDGKLDEHWDSSLKQEATPK